MNEKKTILVFIDWYLPAYKAGGPIKSVHSIVNALKTEFNFNIYTSCYDINSTEPLRGIISNQWTEIDGYKVYYSSLKKERIKSIIILFKSKKYNTIYCNSLFSVWFTIMPIILSKFFLKDTPIIVAPRGMLGEGSLSIKPIKKKIFIYFTKWVGLYKNIIWHVSSNTEKKDVEKNYGTNANICVVPNLSIFPEKNININTNYFNGELNISFLSRISKIKNLHFVIQVLLKLNTNKKIVFDIYGPIEDVEYWEKIKKEITALPSNIQVSYKGEVNPTNVIDVLSNYQIFFFPTLHENFGHVISEALIAGCYILLSNHTPWNDLKEFKAGNSISLNDIEMFVKTLQDLLLQDELFWAEQKKQSINYAKSKLNSSEILNLNRQLFLANTTA